MKPAHASICLDERFPIPLSLRSNQRPELDLAGRPTNVVRDLEAGCTVIRELEKATVAGVALVQLAGGVEEPGTKSGRDRPQCQTLQAISQVGQRRLDLG